MKFIAHRGYSKLELENTKEAFLAAANRSYFGIETDVVKTKDGYFEGHLTNYICVRVKSDEDLSHKFAIAKILSVKDGIAYGILS